MQANNPLHLKASEVSATGSRALWAHAGDWWNTPATICVTQRGQNDKQQSKDQPEIKDN